MKAIHAVNTALWHTGEETQILQTNKTTNYNPLAAAWPWVNHDTELIPHTQNIQELIMIKIHANYEYSSQPAC